MGSVSAEAEEAMFSSHSMGDGMLHSAHTSVMHVPSMRPHSPTRTTDKEHEEHEELGRLSTELSRASKLTSVVKDSKGQKIDKLCGLSEWEPRFLCVTNDKFYILHSEKDDQIADEIPLVLCPRLISTIR